MTSINEAFSFYNRCTKNTYLQEHRPELVITNKTQLNKLDVL